MNAFGYRPDIHITQVLKESSLKQRFTLSAEVIPPRNGAQEATVLGQISDLVDAGAQFLAVTKGAGGSLRGGSLPITQSIKERFQVPAIAHFTCRDLTPQEVENQLMDHHYFGVRNILALRGDPPEGQPNWNPREHAYSYAYQLIEQIERLNAGKYLVRPDMPKPKEQIPTDFCIGAAVYPEHPDPTERITFFRQKVEAGARYGITQMLFDPEAYARFIEAATKANLSIPVLPGTCILKSKDHARRMAARFKVSMPDDLIRDLPDGTEPDAQAKAVAALARFVGRLRKYGAPGLHLFVLFDTEASCALLRAISKIS